MQVNQLQIRLGSKVLVDIGFSINTSLALVGQSGSGKSLTLKALMGMLPASMQLELDIDAPFELKRGENIAFVPQNPFTALSPLTKIKDQFFVPRSRVDEVLTLVDLELELLDRFPPELSGGQLQRVVIAMALSSDPKLLLLDEPTTALDPHTREVVIALLTRLQDELGFKMLFVTHDMQSAKLLCDEICVIRAGKVEEQGMMDAVLHQPKSSYTTTLIEANFANRNFRL
ncbi:MAG: ATP-binding cassette domain-containing protein [Campylobacterota bacterium]|nr:ATP-binding cassette domain-containing protein [Campylobacterota bacterium]